ncbi:hypothetical protein HHI36_010385 [Cryptolaemus montrouzieri]|uniref:Uncharacterized protein n=1 Tax=Cryptolaemus montrouzieri TaxID=559131 RepID=A0ABD2MJ18_9CUCU
MKELKFGLQERDAKTLLEKTGLSCDDLLQKLLAFKSRENESKNTVKETADTTTDKPTVNGNIDSCDSNSSSLTKSHSSTHSSITEENHTLCNNNNDGKKEDPTNEHHFIQEKQSPSRLDSAQSSTTRLEEVKVTTEEFEQNKTKSQESAEVPLETTAALKDKCNKSHKTNTLNQTSRETGNICREHVSYTEGHTVCKPQKLDLEENGCTEKSLGSKQKNKEETLLETTEPLKEASPVHVREQCRGNNVLDFNQRPTGSKSLNSNSNQINSKLIATTCIQKNKKGTIRPFEFISSAYRKVQIKKICTDNSVSVLKQGDTVNKPQQSKNEDLTCEFHFRQEKQSPNSLDSAQSSTSRLNEVKATSEELEQNKTKSRELVKEQLETTAALKDKCNISNETNTWKQVSEEKGNVRREHASYSADSHTVCKPQNSKLEESGCTEKILGSKQKNKEETLLERTEPLKVASPVPVREHNVLDFKQRYTGSKSLNSNSNQENLKVTGTCIQKNTKGTIRPFEFISSAYRKVQTKNICADNSVSVLKQENTVNKSQNLELQNQNDCTEKKLEVTGTLKQKSGEENITVEKISSAYRNDVQKLSRAHTVSTPKHEHTDNKTENSELENQNECTKESLSTADTSIPNTMSLVSKQDDSFTKIQNLGLKKQTDNTKENTNNSEKKSNKEVNKSQNLVLGNANGHAEQNLGIQSLQSSINVESNKDLKDNNHTQSKYQISPFLKKENLFLMN